MFDWVLHGYGFATDQLRICSQELALFEDIYVLVATSTFAGAPMNSEIASLGINYSLANVYIAIENHPAITG